MDSASTGTPGKKPEPRANTRGVGCGRGQANSGANAVRESSSVLKKGNT